MEAMKKMQIFYLTLLCVQKEMDLFSHGLFRLPAYVASLKSKKVNGKARPEIKKNFTKCT